MGGLRLRPPAPDECEALTALCLRSKAVHGYDEAFMAACREELTLLPHHLARDDIVVAEMDGVLAGVAHLEVEGAECGLEKLFVEPDFIGRGVGRGLFDAGVEAARARGARVMIVEADPGAEGFYLAMGARRDGEAPSGSIPGRVLPRLRFVLRQRR